MNKPIKRKNDFLKNTIIALAIMVFFVLDRYFKVLALSLLQGQNYPIIGDTLRFNFVPNYFAAFSLPFSGHLFNSLIILATLALAALSIYFFKKSDKKTSLALLMIMFGAVSNLIDRFSYGFVVDYLDLQYFTIFNGADVMITIGTVFILWKSWKDK
jgi:signal peptidase II